MLDAPTIDSSVLRLAIGIALDRGADPDSFERLAGADLSLLGATSRVSRRVELAVWRVASVEDADVGLFASEAPDLASSFGLLGFFARSSSTVLDALQVGAQYHALLKGDVRVSVRVTPQRVEVVTRATRIPSSAWPRAAIDFSVLPYVTLSRAWSSSPLRPIEVRLTAKRPSNLREYDRLLGCRVLFSQKSNTVVFARDDAEAPLRTAQPDLAKYLRGLAERELARIGNIELDPSTEVREIVAAAISHGGEVRLSNVARACGLSTRTLQRRLRDMDTDFAHVVDEVRATTAVELMRSDGLGLLAVAERVGFADAKSLRRAFIRWTGKIPSDFRRELRHDRHK